jgi:hypothetical protein
MTFIFQQESRREYLRNDKAKTLDVSLRLADRSLTKAVTRQLLSSSSNPWENESVSYI